MTQSAALNRMMVLGVVGYAGLALLVCVLPLPAARLYVLSASLSNFGVAGVTAASIAALAALISHGLARLKLEPARAAQWFALAKSLQPVTLAALALASIASEARPAYQTEMLFGMQLRNHVLVLSGATPADMDQRLARELPPGVRIDRVELSGIGGSVDAALRSADLLRARGVDTSVAVGDCASACAVMFESFGHRYLADQGRLGFHAFSGGGLFGARDEEQSEIARLAARGAQRPYLERLFAHPQLSWPEMAVLREQSLADGCWSEASQAPAACSGALAAR